MRKIWIVFCAVLFLWCINAPSDSYLPAFEWVRKVFEENDAGFAYAMENIDTLSYEKHHQLTVERIKTIDDSAEFVSVINQWLSFFRSGHVYFGKNTNTSPEELEKKVSNTETYTVDLPVFKNDLQKKNTVDYEGIWESGHYEIGIQRDGKTYIGFIIEADGIYWQKEQIKLKIFDNKNDNSAIFYMRDHSEYKTNEVELIGKNCLKIGHIYFKRTFPTYEEDKDFDEFCQLISANKPFLKKWNENTLLFRIPSFAFSEKKDIDNIITANRETILETENLIIDLRNNGGGSDNSFQNLLPFLYTNPIRTVGVEFLSTELNNQRMRDYIENPASELDEESKRQAEEALEKLMNNLGTFVRLNPEIVTITESDTIYQNPKKIAILINENCGSTTEQFLLAAKQSKKVKLFGTTTTGVLDISNMYFVTSPCEGYNLGYSISKSMRIPEMTIDDKGIQPDFYIDKTIPGHKWIQFAAKVLED